LDVAAGVVRAVGDGQEVVARRVVDGVHAEAAVADEAAQTADERISDPTDAGRLALSHLLASSVRAGPDGKSTITVAALLEELRDLGADLAKAPLSDPSYGEIKLRLERRIKEAGMLKLRWDFGPEPGLYLGNTSPAINAVFRDTTWANRVWRQVLRDLPNARDGGSIHFRGGGQDRAVFLPAAALRLPESREVDPLAAVLPAVAEGGADPPL
jgi:hypothetical protein